MRKETFCSIFPVIIALVCCFPSGCGAQATEAAASSIEKKIETESDTPWKTELASGTDRIFYFAEAVSGKKLKPETYKLLLGVNEVLINNDKITFHRSDGEKLEFSRDSTHGSKFFDDWDKSKINLEHKFGPAGKEFLESVEKVQVDGNRIGVIRKGADDVQVELGKRKIHHAFDLRALRFRKLSMLVDTSAKSPELKDITGVSAILNMPGFSFPVDVKEFRKIRLEKENDIKVGVRNPVPKTMRTILFLPSILRFHFKLARKEE